MRRSVFDDERRIAREHLLDLGILREIDGQVAELLVVRRGHDVTNVLLLANEDDGDAVDLRNLGETLNDREEDAAEVEVRREGLRQLEDDLRILLFLTELLHRRAEAELPADARHE